MPNVYMLITAYIYCFYTPSPPWEIVTQWYNHLELLYKHVGELAMSEMQRHTER